MEKLLQTIIDQQKKYIKFAKKQNNLINAIAKKIKPMDKDTLKQSVMDNTDLKEVFNVANTKFFSMKKLFKTYELDNTDYYLADDVLKTIRKHKKSK